MATIEDRVAMLEQQLAALSDRVTMEAGLAAARDRDLSNLTVTVNSHTAMLQAVQERQAEHTERFNEVDRRFTEVDRRFTAIDRELGVINAGQRLIIDKLTQLIERDGE